MKRYDLVTNYRCGDAIEEMESADDGDWVRYEDVEAAAASLGSPETPQSERTQSWAVTVWRNGESVEGRVLELVEKWREDANESTAFADNDEGAAPPQNVAHARGMAMAFNVCADELEAALAPLAEPPT